MIWFSWPDWCLAFFSIVLEGAPFLLLGALVSALVDRLVSPALLKRVLPAGEWSGAAAAVLASALLPLCECSAIPVVRRLIQKGVRPGVATVYLLASPLFNPLSVLSTWLAFRNQMPWQMVGLRLGIGLLVLVLLSAWILRLKPETYLRAEALQGGGAETSSGTSWWQAGVMARGPWGPWLASGQIVLGDFLAVLPYLVLGAGVAAWVGTGLSQTFVGVWAGHRLAGPATGVVLSQILCLCSTTDAFVAAAMPVLSLPARLAFLVAGPLFDLKLLWLYRAMYRPEFVRGLWLRVSLGTFVLTVLLGFWL